MILLLPFYYSTIMVGDMAVKYFSCCMQEDLYNRLEATRGNILRSKFVSKCVKEALDKK